MDLTQKVCDPTRLLFNYNLFEGNQPLCDALKLTRLDGHIRAVQTVLSAWHCRGTGACVAGQCESMVKTEKQGGQVMRTNTFGALSSCANFDGIAGLAIS